jgi:hypothetical protein
MNTGTKVKTTKAPQRRTQKAVKPAIPAPQWPVKKESEKTVPVEK